jgi:hypothetical protein
VKTKRVLLVGSVMIPLAACGGAYKQAVATYAGTLQQRTTNGYACIMPELRKELVLNDAGLACLVDKDRGKSETSACKCTEGRPNTWEANCANWMSGQ